MRFIALIIIVLSISSCTFDTSDMIIPAPPVSDTIIVSFTNDIVPILQTYCYGTGNQLCHVSNSNQFAVGDFTICSELRDRALSGVLASRIFSPNGGMPPSYSNSPTTLSDSAKQILELWIEQGAKCD